ncbi:MAG: hypothetical protein GAK28_03941 [Luteibacter sp.]|nr:MAG: hypothetical protein GAK28_03941 [Luteibacter sp.]
MISFAKTDMGHQCHGACQRLGRHCHDAAFATVVLSGGYMEAGDEGRRTVEAGHVLIHRAYDSHTDCFSRHGAELLVLPVPTNYRLPLFGTTTDPEGLLHIARHSPRDAWHHLAATWDASEQRHQDWPDLLAERLRQDADLSLRQWAEETGLRPESVSRGFQRAYGTSPKAFRARSRTRSALQRLCETRQSLCEISSSLGFADQAHMSRSVLALTGFTPGDWRRSIPSSPTPAKTSGTPPVNWIQDAPLALP